MTDDPDNEWHLAGPTETSDPYQVLKQWEKLRLVYNALLIPWTVILIALLPGAGTGNPAEVLVGGVVANVGFCLGPVLEGYLVRIGASAKTARGWLFALGTALTAIAASIALTQ